MQSVSLSETATVAPRRIVVEHRDGRTVFSWSWRKPWSWTSIVNTCAVLAAYLIFDAVRSSWTRRDAIVSLLAAVVGVSLFIGIEYLRHRYGRMKGRLEVSSGGIQMGHGRRTIRMGEDTFPLDRIMGAKAGSMQDGFWGVGLMVPGRFVRTAVSGLATREEAEWLADAIEAEIRACGYEL
jgi:hypothetical protein